MKRRLLQNKKEVTSIPIDSNTIYLLHGDTTTDESGNGNSISGTASASSSGGYFGLGYLSFGPSYLTFNYSLGTVYTIEFWMNRSSSSGAESVLIDTNGNSDSIVALRRDTAKWTLTETQTADIDTYTESSRDDEWIHVAFVRNGSSYKVFENGHLIMGASSSTSNYRISLGRLIYRNQSRWRFYGKMCEIRVSNIARYSSSFTPYTVPFG